MLAAASALGRARKKSPLQYSGRRIALALSTGIGSNANVLFSASGVVDCACSANVADNVTTVDTTIAVIFMMYSIGANGVFACRRSAPNNSTQSKQ